MRERVRSYLAGDGQLAGLLTGGIHGGTLISRATTPEAFDASREIRPCALVKLETTARFGPHEAARRSFVVVYVYQRSGFEIIDAAIARIDQLLDGVKLGDGVWDIRLADQVSDLEDPALECALGYSRYVIVRVRQEVP